MTGNVEISKMTDAQVNSAIAEQAMGQCWHEGSRRLGKQYRSCIKCGKMFRRGSYKNYIRLESHALQVVAHLVHEGCQFRFGPAPGKAFFAQIKRTNIEADREDEFFAYGKTLSRAICGVVLMAFPANKKEK